MQNFIRYKNTKVAYSLVGKGTTVVLLHGFLENSSMWNTIAKKLAKRNRIICIDLLGHGKSECIGYIHSMELMAEAVKAVLKHLRIRRSIFIGHSMGGYVALAFAEKFSKNVKGFCLMNSTTFEDDDERKKLRIKANKMIQNNFESMVRVSFTNLFSEHSKIQFKEEMQQALQEALKTKLQGYIACQEGMRIRCNRVDILKNSNYKKLFVIGKKDPVLNYQKLLQEAEKTNSESVLLEEGHMSHIENKEELINAIKYFIRSC